MIAFVPLLIPIGIGAFAIYAFYRGANSDTESIPQMSTTTGTTLPADVMASLGWPYFFGKGGPSTPWLDGANGVDCSGYAQMVLVRLGILKATDSDRGARALADAFKPVAVGMQKIGDLAYYPGHVMVVAGPPGSDGHSPVIGASGGTETTLGNNVNAKVKLFSTGKYRPDFVTYMRAP